MILVFPELLQVKLVSQSDFLQMFLEIVEAEFCNKPSAFPASQ